MKDLECSMKDAESLRLFVESRNKILNVLNEKMRLESCILKHKDVIVNLSKKLNQGKFKGSNLLFPE